MILSGFVASSFSEVWWRIVRMYVNMALPKWSPF